MNLKHLLKKSKRSLHKNTARINPLFICKTQHFKNRS